MPTPGIHSIQVRLQRVTSEHAYVTVFLDDSVLRPPDERGARGIDADKLLAAAIEMGSDPAVKWAVEDLQLAVHPIQGPAEGASN